MKKVKVEVIGPEPACVLCETTKKIAEKTAEKLGQTGIAVEVEKANIISKEILLKYGLLLSPATAIDGTVRIMGRVPTETEIEKLIKAASTRGA
jgi:hypothetical protein